MTDSALLTSWAVCGIAAAAARFVPVPLLDDVVRERATQVAVLRTLRAHGRTDPSDRLEALWELSGGQGSGLRRRFEQLPSRLLLFPVRRYRAVFGAVRGVPTDVLRVVLLGRTLDRVLERGGLAASERLPDEARALRRAVDEVLDAMDLHLLTTAVRDVLSQSRGLSAAAIAFVRERFSAGGTDTDLEPAAPLRQSAEQVTGVLGRPDIARLLEEFDRQVDGRLSGSGA